MACSCQNNQNQETEEKKGLVDNIKDKIEEVKKLWDESDEKTKNYNNDFLHFNYTFFK